MLLKDKVVVVTGIGIGMGQAMGRIAAAEGAKVALASRNKDFIDNVAKEIKEAGGHAIAMPTDVTSKEQCEAIVAAAEKEFGPVTGVINSAYSHGSWATCDVADAEEWAGVYNINCVGALRMSQAALPSMQKAGSGAIVNVSTMATVNPFPGESAYAASKGGLLALSKHMAKDFGKYNVTVNAVRMGWIGGAPVYGYIDQQVQAGRDRDEVVAEITARIPLGIIPPEDDCAKAVLSLVSDYSRVVTGATLDINGGQYMAP